MRLARSVGAALLGGLLTTSCLDESLGPTATSGNLRFEMTVSPAAGTRFVAKVAIRNLSRTEAVRLPDFCGLYVGVYRAGRRQEDFSGGGTICTADVRPVRMMAPGESITLERPVATTASVPVGLYQIRVQFNHGPDFPSLAHAIYVR